MPASASANVCSLHARTGRATSEPLVSILTPVYNGERFLVACIESILAQRYQNWEYTIVNNCSTDRTVEIAGSYAARDSRIRLHCNTEFVNADANHNIAFRQISKDSKYCKVVSADDWLDPECLKELVAMAEANPSAGLIGSYQRSGNTIRWKGLPVDVTFVAGKDIGRRSLLREIDVLGAPTSVLYRADLVRQRKQFFPHTQPHADTSVCFELFRQSDFGFVHKVLSYERLHEAQVSSETIELSAGTPAHIEMIQEYGSAYLDPPELRALLTTSVRDYYRWLGGCILKLKGRRFWQFHSRRLRELGLKVDWGRICLEAVKESLWELRHPLTGMQKFAAAVEQLRRR